MRWLGGVGRRLPPSWKAHHLPPSGVPSGREERTPDLRQQWSPRRAAHTRARQAPSRAPRYGAGRPGGAAAQHSPRESTDSALRGSDTADPRPAPGHPDLPWAPAPRLQRVQNQAEFFFSFFLEIGVGVSLRPSSPSHTPTFFFFF